MGDLQLLILIHDIFSLDYVDNIIAGGEQIVTNVSHRGESAWATKNGDTEHVSMTSFAIKFHYIDRHTAEEDYHALINSPKILKARRQRLLTSLKTFNANRADSFWERRATIARADIIAMKAAVDSMEVGHRQSKIIYQEYFEAEHPESCSSNEHGPQEQDISDSHGTGQVDTDDEVQHDDTFNREEISSLLANIVQAQHPVCEWKSVEDTCIACLFQDYQRDCVQALRDNKLRKADIADAIMRAIFKTKVLSQLVTSFDLPDPDIDDAAVLKAVRLRMNNKCEDASEALNGMNRRLRLMFDNLLESLPEEVDRSISEATFTVNYVAPVLNSMLKIKGRTEVHY
ncbi:hypothetical protein BGW41_007027 [Actinomortierella wolfii]|nr:hypothetical protein BGW41_007027 [Actinomortierella wolfii]